MYLVNQSAFSGPLHSLLHLVKKHKIDPIEIKMSEITGDYLEQISSSDSLDIEVSSDFLVTMSLLLVIKSNMLLPQTEEEETDSEEPLTHHLVEYRLYKGAADWFEKRIEETSDIFSNIQIGLYEEEKEVEVSFLLLISIAKELLSPFRETREEEFVIDEVMLSEKMEEIKERLKCVKKVQFAQLLSKERKLTEFVVTFLALLELIKQRVVKVTQNKPFGSIWIRIR
jgi:segregation and condensation protein A